VNELGREQMVDACEALDIAPGQLADIFRHESARVLRALADDLDAGNEHVDADALVSTVLRHLDRFDALDMLWIELNPDGEESVEAASGGTEATPLHRDAAAAAAREDTR
jgi:hypothetical protein